MAELKGSDGAAVLRSARALLHLNVKAVARAFRVSDKTLTQLETFIASEDEAKAGELADYYHDLGVKCGKKGAVLTRAASPLVLTAIRSTNPPAVIDRLTNALRHVGGLAFNLKRTNKFLGSPYDTVEMQFPIVTQRMVRDILLERVKEEEGLRGVDPDGTLVGRDGLEDHITRMASHRAPDTNT